MRSSLPSQALSAFIVLILISGIISAGCTDLPALPAGQSHEAQNSGELRVYFFDVGQGDSALLLFRDRVILIDSGEADMGERIVGNLRKLGADHIDLLVATHPHSDHIGGMQKVLAAFPVREVLDTGLPHTSQMYGHFLETVDRQDIRYIVAEQGRTADPDPSLSVLILSPPETRLDDDLNANSIMLKITYGNISFLFTGDAGDGAETALMRTGYSLNAQVLKVAHHGSSDATSPEFLSRVRPEVAVISLSKDNPYGYPHRETLDALQAAVPAIYRTDRDGTVLIRSDGVSYSVTAENGHGGIRLNPFSPSPATSLETPAPPITPVSSLPAGSTSPFPSPIPSAVQIGNASFVKIDGIQFNAPGDDRKNLNGEWVRIRNSGDGPVLIAGWKLSDMSGADPYIFPAYLLLSGASVTVYTGSGVMNDTALFMGRNEPVWGNSGDTAFLRDGRGNLVDKKAGGLS